MKLFINHACLQSKRSGGVKAVVDLGFSEFHEGVFWAEFHLKKILKLFSIFF